MPMILHPSFHARTMPDKTAYRMAGSGAAITYGELDRVSNQAAQLFRSLGLQPQDHIALLAENSLKFLEICWAAQRCGLYYTAISTHLTPGEIAYIATDCGAEVFITTERLADIAGEAAEMIPAEVIRYMSGHAAAGWLSWDAAIAAMPAVPITDETPATRCSIPRARRGGRRASSGNSSASRSGTMAPLADLLCRRM
jgi:long-chain acyl-CoA synthetase